MKKTILMTLAALGLAGIAQADYSVTLDSSYYNGLNDGKASWVYVWTGSSTGDYTSASNWSCLKSTSNQTMVDAVNGPTSADPSFIGYDFSYVDGKQIMTANDTAITATAHVFFSHVFLGNNVTITGNGSVFSGNRNTIVNFGDLGQTSSSFEMSEFYKQDGTVTFEGTLDMTASTFSYKLFSATNMVQYKGTWAANFDITDQYGQTLQYAGMGSENVGKDGYYWLSEVTDGTAVTISIVAQATPEPTTATLSLLALAGLCARRRRK